MSDQHLIDILQTQSWRDILNSIRTGFKAPAGSPERRYAHFVLTRIILPPVASIGLSVGIVVVLAVMNVGQQIAAQREIEVKDVNIESVPLEKIDMTEIQPEQMETVTVNVDNPSIVPGPPSLEPQTTVGQSKESAPEVAFAPVLTRSPVRLKGLVGNRSKEARGSAERQFKASSINDLAVNKALRWLKKNQKPDGSWDPAPSASAITGLALLAFLAHNETPVSKEFGPTVEKALKFLLAHQQPNGQFTQTGSNHSYGNAIATYALCEAYALTRIMMIRDAAEKGVASIIAGQQPGGGWDYNYAKGKRWDSSVTGWQMQALKAARMAGIQNKDLEPAIDKGVKFLMTSAYMPKTAVFSYSCNEKTGEAGGPGRSTTGIGVLCLQLLGHGKTAPVRGGLKTLEAEECKWASKPTKGPKGEDIPAQNTLYAWYYITQAKFHEGGATWEAWNRQFSPALIQNQEADGHWEHGDWGVGNAYNTSLCALMLEVYYRYLPTYKKVEDAAPVKATSEDDVVIDVM